MVTSRPAICRQHFESYIGNDQCIGANGPLQCDLYVGNDLSIVFNGARQLEQDHLDEAENGEQGGPIDDISAITLDL